MDLPLGYDLLVDPELTPDPSWVTVDLREGTPVTAAAAALEALLLTDGHLGGIVVVVEGRLIGATSRAFLEAEFFSGRRTFSDGDRAAQPGQSTAFRLIRFECGVCDRTVHRIFYDERAVPVCHGPMRLVR
ncbi:hypothetical protein AB0E59_34080 [Lentzea sp. NPDC034063]|uniref:hypothetical protein n=1 Tax=unclassified Lentzea TaxID=2643253 RepID=UPI00340B71AD